MTKARTKAQRTRASKKKSSKRSQNPSTGSATVDHSSAPAAISAERFYRGPQMRTLVSGKVTRSSNSGSLVRLTSSATAGSEVTGTVKFNVRNATELGWLSGIGQRFSKYRVISAKFTWEPVVGSNTPGEICMALLYDVGDVSAPLTVDRLMETDGSRWASIWMTPKSPVSVDPSRFALKWYLSGASGGTAAENMQTPFELAYAASSSLVSTPLGRILTEYVVEFTEPISVPLNF